MAASDRRDPAQRQAAWSWLLTWPPARPRPGRRIRLGRGPGPSPRRGRPGWPVPAASPGWGGSRPRRPAACSPAAQQRDMLRGRGARGRWRPATRPAAPATRGCPRRRPRWRSTGLARCRRAGPPASPAPGSGRGGALGPGWPARCERNGGASSLPSTCGFGWLVSPASWPGQAVGGNGPTAPPTGRTGWRRPRPLIDRG